mgnify:CR=1 FL=1
MNEMSNETPSMDMDLNPSLGRRGLFRLGGLTVATVVVAAACSDVSHQQGNVGDAVGTTPVLPDPIVNDGVYLRTMAGLETSIANAYQHMLDNGSLAKSSATFPSLGDQSDLVARFQQHHVAAAKVYNELVTAEGAEPWTCGNIRMDDTYINPVFARVENVTPAGGNSKEIPASDDITRDYVNLVHTLESVSAESAQAMVPLLSKPEYRAAAMTVGATSSRQAALIALKINPGGYAAAAAIPVVEATTTTAAATTTTAAPAEGGAEPPQTEIPLPLALPGNYGLLSPITYIGGHGDENGVRLKLNFETPSLNMYAYPYIEACKA